MELPTLRNEREKSEVVVDDGGGELPSGWTEEWTEDHLQVFKASPDGKSQWERPSASLQAVPGNIDDTIIPEGW